MSTRARVDAFEAWLRREGTEAEVALFNRSIADGFVAVSGTGRVTAAHVAMSCQLARDAGMNTTAMEQLGALFVRYGDSAAVALLTAMVAEPEVAAPAVAMAAPPLRPGSAPIFEPPDDDGAPLTAAAPAPAAPLVVSFRAAPTGAAIPVVAARAAEDDAAAAVLVPPPRTRTRRRAVSARTKLLALGAAAVVAIAAVYGTRGEGGDGGGERQALAGLELDAELPAGWRVAPDPRGLGAVPTELASRGGSPADPDDRAFLAALPIREVLADADVTSEAIVRAAQRAEKGTAARLAADGGTYITGGCTASTVAALTAVCRGTMREGGQTLALQTYLRVGGARAVVALFVAKLTVADPAAEADQMMRSIKL